MNIINSDFLYIIKYLPYFIYLSGLYLLYLFIINKSYHIYTVKHIIIYPIKSCAGLYLDSSILNNGGFKHDREWLIVFEDNHKMVTIRNYPQLSLLKPSFTDDGLLKITDPNDNFIIVDSDIDNTTEIQTNIWDAQCYGIDQGDNVSKFLTNYLKYNVRLIKMKSPNKNLHDSPKYSSLVSQIDRTDCYTSYSDWSSLSLISMQSLEWLNSELYANNIISNNIPITQFRPNIVIDTREPFEEETWKNFTIGNVDFQFLKRCSRCIVSTVNPDTGIRHKSGEPLKTLKLKRSGYYNILKNTKFYKKEAFFAINIRNMLTKNESQVISIGDKLTINSLQ